MFPSASLVEGLKTCFLFLLDLQTHIYPTESKHCTQVYQIIEQVQRWIYHWDYYVPWTDKRLNNWNWNCLVIFAFYKSHFIVVLDSVIRMSACFWLFGIQWLTYDCLWSRDLTDDALILAALHHYKPILDRRRRSKCSAVKIRRQVITFLLVENEFWVQRHGYETDDLKKNLQTKIFNREWKRSGFIWLHWIQIGLFPTAVGGIDFKR